LKILLGFRLYKSYAQNFKSPKRKSWQLVFVGPCPGTIALDPTFEEMVGLDTICNKVSISMMLDEGRFDLGASMFQIITQNNHVALS
jgi:hypothetical protein